MLVLARKPVESLIVPDLNMTITVLSVRGGKVRLGISAPSDVAVWREEVWNRMIDRDHTPELVGESVEVLAHR